MSDKIEHISIARAIAIVLIVFGHSIIIYSGDWIYVSVVKYFPLKVLKHYIYSFHLPLFVFVSGYLYYISSAEKNRNERFLKLIKKKANRLLVPYLFVATIWMIPIKYIIGFHNNADVYDIYIRGILLSKDPGHLWFLLMLFNVFVLFYLLNTFILSKSSLMLSAVLIFAVGLSGQYATNLLQIQQSFGYLMYFYAGYIWARHRIFLDSFILRNNWFIIALGFTHLLFFVARSYFYIHKGKNFYANLIDKSFEIFVALAGILFIYSLCLHLSSKTKINNSRLISLLEKNSLIIYLFHQPLLYIYYLNLWNKNVPPIMVIMMCFITGLSVPLLISKVVNKSETLKYLTKGTVS